METRSWRAARLIGQTIARHAGKRAGAVLSTAILAGMAQVAYIDPLNGHAIHDGLTETGCTAGMGRTRIDAWYDCSPGRWLRLLAEAKPLREALPAVGHQSFWH